VDRPPTPLSCTPAATRLRYDSSTYQTTVLPKQIILLDSLEVTADDSHNFDLQTATVSGQVLLNGRADAK